LQLHLIFAEETHHGFSLLPARCIQTVEEIRSKRSLLHHGIQVSMRGGNNPHVECNFSVLSDA
jgi:hypothetical protein